MERIYTYSFQDNFISRLTDFIEENYLKPKRDLSRLAVVFGGKRPILFLKRELAQRIGKNFFPPVFFSIDEFVRYTLLKKQSFTNILDLELCYLVYKLARDLTPAILKNRGGFAEFLAWVREIISFIERIDLEDIASPALRAVEQNAQIGYSIPQDINNLLEHVIVLRETCHKVLREDKKYTRGLQYLQASRAIDQTDFSEFDQILFCNFFYLHETERKILKSLYDRHKAVLFFQGDEAQWPVLKSLGGQWGVPIRPSQDPPQKSFFPLQIYTGFDVHSQVGQVREILKKIPALDKTVIVLPEPDHLIPLLGEIASLAKDCNISMGYPLKRSSLYSLLELIFKAQLSRKGSEYYAKDYLKLLRHPLVKNLKLATDPVITRVLVHKIEEILTGEQKASLSGRLFVGLEEVENLHALYEISASVLPKMTLEISREELKTTVERLHRLLFHSWEDLHHLYDFLIVLENFLNTLITKSFLYRYPLNRKIAFQISLLKEEFKAASFNQEGFLPEEIFKIFRNRMEQELVAFLGSPLRGLQILGLFETRSLNFEYVIVMDVNEGILPKLRVYEPFIPREVMVNLGLGRLEQEEEIQRYQFMRLISSAKEVHLIYEEDHDKEKSRFIEELIWDKQKKDKTLDIINPLRSSFQVKMVAKKTAIPKRPETLEFLKSFRYSASSVNTYVRCPLRFYYHYVLGLNEKEDILEEPENKEIGIFIHDLLEEAFKPFRGSSPIIDERFRKHFQRKLDQKFAEDLAKTMGPEAFLLRAVLKVRLDHFLDKEAEKKDFRNVSQLITVEERFVDQIPLAGLPINFVYKVDRIDRLEDRSILILDYKTGSQDPMPRAWEQQEGLVWTREAIKETIRSFQIPLYLYFFDKQYPRETIHAAFYNLRTAVVSPFLDDELQHHRRQIIEAFLRPLDFVLREILNPEVLFKPDDSDARYCAACPFYDMCR